MRFCPLPATIPPLTSATVQVRRLTDESIVEISNEAACVLHLCDGLRTVDQHVLNIKKRLGFDYRNFDCRDENYRMIIATLISRGLLIPESALPIHRVSGRPLILENIAIVTKDRPEQLAISLETIIRTMRSRRAPVTVSIYDDSITADSRARIRTMVEGVGPSDQLHIRILDRYARDTYVDQLSNFSGIEKAIIEFALTGASTSLPTAGALRNHALLDLSGRPLVFMDDDIVPRILRSTCRSPGVAVSSRYMPSKVQLFDTLKEACRGMDASGEDPLDPHLSCLGKTLNELVLPPSDAPLVLDCKPSLWNAVLHPAGRVSATQLGIVGDPGHSSAAWLLCSSGSDMLPNFSKISNHAVKNGICVARIVDRLTISDSPFCMSYAVGIVNDAETPPFFPVGRNGDGVFGSLLRAGDGPCYFAHLPVAVVHTKKLVPLTLDTLWRSAGRVRISDIIRFIVSTYSSRPHDQEGGESIRAVGRYIRHIIDCSNSQLLQVLRDIVGPHLARRSAGVEDAYRYAVHSRSRWAPDVQKARQQLLMTLASRWRFLPSDIRGNSDEEVIEQTRKLLDLFGALLETWGTIKDAADHLNAISPS